jgi:hypothetical protein
MQRLVGARRDIRQIDDPIHVQSQGPVRLASSDGNETLLVDKTCAVSVAVRATEGRRLVLPLLASMWVAALERKAAC